MAQRIWPDPRNANWLDQDNAGTTAPSDAGP